MSEKQEFKASAYHRQRHRRDEQPSSQAGAGDAMSTKPYRPISAAEGDFFIAAQCGNCTKQDGCRIVLLTMVRSEDDPKYPKEWVSDADGNNPRCTAREVTLATVLAEAIKENQELIANCGQNQIQGKVTT